MADSWDDDTYVLNSKYRVAVVGHLGTDAPATPTQIASTTDLRQPHVSRALSELLDRDVVEALAPEEPSRRHFYRLTETGERIWERNRDEFQPLVLRRLVGPSEPEEALVESLRERFGDDLLGVARFESEELSMLYLNPSVDRARSDEELLDAFRTLLYERAGTRFDGVHRGGDLEYDVLGFEQFGMLRVYLAEDDWLVVSLEADATYELASLVEDCVEPFREAGVLEDLGMAL